MTSLSMEKRPMKLEEIEEELPLHKRRKSSYSEATYKRRLDSSECLVLLSLNEPGPLGLKLTKSPSFLELIQKRLSQDKKNHAASRSKNLEVGDKEKTSSPIDKLKASNFSALSLKIGKWEYISQREGDLVVKCYFAKQKLVWEVLHAGLKNKIEIQLSDIVGLKANFPDNGPGSLTVVLGKKPLFFRETNPQPRKHTLWVATPDFTDGNASTYRQNVVRQRVKMVLAQNGFRVYGVVKVLVTRDKFVRMWHAVQQGTPPPFSVTAYYCTGDRQWQHHLQCAQGVLNKHYEKLIHCDTRLKLLTQQPDPVSWLPSAAVPSIKPPNVSGDSVMPSTSKSSFLHTGELGAVSLVCKDIMKDVCLPNPEVSTHDFEEYVMRVRSSVEGQKTIEQLKSLMIQQTISVTDLVVNHVGHCISEKEPARILPSIENVWDGDNQKDIVGDMSKILLGDSQLMPPLDDPTLSRIDALLLHGLLHDCGAVETNAKKNNLNVLQDGNDSSIPDCNKTLEDVVKESGEEDYDHVSGYRKALSLSRKDSFTDFLHQLPGITSLPSFCCDDLSDDDEI